MKLPRRVTICEVGTRDGFQIEPDFIATDRKIDVVNRLAAAGMPRIEVTSFVSPKAIPQLRDAAEVMAAIVRRPGTLYSALVPNDKGAARAVDARVDEIHTVVSASESHNLANVNMTIGESLTKLAAVAEVARRATVPVVSGISCSFGCPFEGDVPVDHLESVVARLVDMGARGIGLADTTGMANPAQVARVLERLVPRFPGVEWTLHTHDTRAMAIPNIMAAMGARRLPLRPRRLRQRVHRGPDPLPARHGRGDRGGPRCADRGLEAGAGDRGPRPARPAREGRQVGPALSPPRRRARADPDPPMTKTATRMLQLMDRNRTLARP